MSNKKIIKKFGKNIEEKTPLQNAIDEKLKAQQILELEVAKEIQQILEKNQLKLTVEHLIKVVK